MKLLKLTDSQSELLQKLVELACDSPGAVGMAASKNDLADGNVLLRHGLVARYKFENGAKGFQLTNKGMVAASLKWPDEFVWVAEDDREERPA